MKPNSAIDLFRHIFPILANFAHFFVLVRFVCDFLSNSSCESFWFCGFFFILSIPSVSSNKNQTRLQLRLNFNTSMNHRLSDEHFRCTVYSVRPPLPKHAISFPLYVLIHILHFVIRVNFVLSFFSCSFCYPVQFFKLNIVLKFQFNSIHQFACFSQFVSRLILPIKWIL